MYSILIPTFNNYKYLRFTIQSIKNTSKLDNEILVHVSDDYNNETRNFLKNENIKFTYSEKNIGLCSAINLISKYSNKKYIIYSHDDMYFCPDWEKTLTKEIINLGHDKFYFSGSMIEQNSGHIKFNCGENLENFNEKKLLDNIKDLNIKDHQGSHFAPHCIHRNMWLKVNGFSEEFNPGIASDPDFNMKLWNEGVRIFKGLNDFKVYHFGSITTRKNKYVKQNRGDITFIKKWGFSTKFFKKYYLKSNTIYFGPLDEPKKNFYYFFDLIKCKIKLLYLKIFTK
jgi:GT2 family glycosyltransferase